MSVEAFSYIMGLVVQIVTIIQIIIMLPAKRSFRFTVIALSVFAAAYYCFLHFTGSIFLSNSGLRGLVWLPPVLLLFGGQFFQKVFAFFLQYLLSFLQYSLETAVIGLFLQPGSEMFYLVCTITGVILFSAYITVMFIYGRGFFQKLFSYGSERVWALYAFGAAFSFAIPIVERSAPESVWRHIMALLFTLWSFSVLCFAIVNAHKNAKQRYEAEFARGIVSSGHDHYQKMNEMYEKLRVLRHDYKYHLGAAREMLGSGDTEGADKYLTGIENQLSEYELKKYCSNPVINALVVGYAERCAKLNIKFTVNINVPGSLGIPDYDLCIAVGNLLENAVEACEGLEHGRVIKLETRNTSAQLLLMVKNSFDGAICHDDGTPVSAKTNGGFGLRSVKEVVIRNGGTLTVEWDKDTFTAFASVRL